MPAGKEGVYERVFTCGGGPVKNVRVVVSCGGIDEPGYAHEASTINL